MRLVAVIVSLAVLPFFIECANAAQPSFDCSKAKKPAEQVVCGSDRLALLDNIVARGYIYLKAVEGRQLADAMAGPYLLKRYKCGFSEECIGKLYLQEIIDFRQLGVPVKLPMISDGEQRAFNQEPVSTPNAGGSSIKVALVDAGGTYSVPVTINGQITLNFVVDSGATDVSIPADVVLTLSRTGTITSADFIGSQTYVMADGSTVPSERFIIRSLNVGSATLENVTASVAPVAGSLLLGQSFLKRFSSWSLDNASHVLVLNLEASLPSNEKAPTELVRQFYKALSEGNGLLASEFIVPEKRAGPFSAAAMTDFYSKLIEKMHVVSIEPIGENAALAQYTFISNTGACDGKAVVTTQTRPDGVFISAIKALNGC